MKTFKPIVAVGAEHALEEELLMADYFRKRRILYLRKTVTKLRKMARMVSQVFMKA